MKIGNIVKGLENKCYTITNEKMTRGVIVDVRDGYDECIKVKVLQHEDGNSGSHWVDSKCFEVIGEIKPFDREELLKRLADGEKEAIFDYDLQEANLRGANLQEANLQGANLQGANLQEANLRGANLQEANLQEANLRGANLQEANLQGANLQEANLRGANLQEANLRGANLQEANLDFSCLPLWCGSLLVNMDDRQVKQLLYHTLSIVKHSNNVSEVLKEQLLTDSNIKVAKEFHRASECGKL